MAYRPEGAVFYAGRDLAGLLPWRKDAREEKALAAAKARAEDIRQDEIGDLGLTRPFTARQGGPARPRAARGRRTGRAPADADGRQRSSPEREGATMTLLSAERVSVRFGGARGPLGEPPSRSNPGWSPA